jgi:hypothetical protein
MKRHILLIPACLVVLVATTGCGTSSNTSAPSSSTATNITNGNVAAGLVSYRGIEFRVPKGFSAGLSARQFQGHDEIQIVPEGTGLDAGKAVVIIWPYDHSDDAEGGHPEWKKVSETQVAGYKMVKWVTSGGQGSPVYVLLGTPVENLKVTGQVTMAQMKPDEVAESIIKSVRIP